MKGFFSNVSPRRAIKDLWTVLGAPSEFRWPALALAAMVTGGIFWVMVHQEGRGLPPPPKVIYFESWRADRSDAEIIAGNIAAAKKRRDEEAAEESRAEDIRQMYKAVGAATGINTQKMYDEGKVERETENKAEQARARALLDRYLDKSTPETKLPPETAKTPSAQETPVADH